MSAFYLLARSFLFALHVFVRFRAWRFESRSAAANVAAEEALKATGAAHQPNPILAARAQMALAVAAQRLGDVEERYVTWQQRSEALQAGRDRLARWSGKALIYLAADVALLVLSHLEAVRGAYAAFRDSGVPWW
jgi:hypothetical protein